MFNLSKKIKEPKEKKPRKKLNIKIGNRTIVGLVCIVLAFGITFGVAPFLPKLTDGKCDIVRIAKPVERGQKITEADIEVIKVGEYNLPDVLKNPKDVVGKYATADLFKGDYLFADKLTPHSNSADDILESLNGKKVAISVEIQSFAEGISDKIRNGDIVSPIVFDKENNISFTPQELRYLQVITTTTDEGIDEDEKVEKGKAVTVTLLVTPEQAELLAMYNGESSIHFALVYRGEKDKADEFIKIQDDYLVKHPIEHEAVKEETHE